MLFSKNLTIFAKHMDKKLILFDFDGTLCDTRESIVKTYHMVIDKLGLEDKDDDLLASTIGTPLVKAYPQLFPEMTPEEAANAVVVHRSFWDTRQDILQPKLFPGVAETLEELSRRGHLMTIASARRKDTLKHYLNIFGVSQYFDFVLGVEDVVNAKPDPEAVLVTLKHYGCDASEAFMVGDMPVDILMASGAGVAGCGVTYGNSCREDLSASGAMYVIDEFKELLDIPFIR